MATIRGCQNPSAGSQYWLPSTRAGFLKIDPQQVACETLATAIGWKQSNKTEGKRSCEEEC